MYYFVKHRTAAFYLIFSFLVIPFLSGCGEKLPDGMPRIYPCSITIKQEGTPLAGALVVAVPDDPNLAKWPVQGTTNESGTANLFTRGKYKGVPEGQYTLLISKNESEYVNKTQSNDPEGNRGPVRFIDYVDPSMSDKAKSPHKVQIKSEKNHFEIDAGKKIRKETIVDNC